MKQGEINKMKAINYLKLDLRVIKGKITISVILPILIGITVVFANNIVIFGSGYLLFLLIGLATMPFDSTISENSSKMYGLFPAKISSMVFGRFMYLIIAALSIFTIDGAIILYLYNSNAISINGITGILLSAIIALAICFCQYPIYYKFGIEKGRSLSMLIYLIPRLAVFALTSVISKDNENTNMSGVLNFILNNRLTLDAVAILICIIIGIISYHISCKICKAKEI